MRATCVPQGWPTDMVHGYCGTRNEKLERFQDVRTSLRAEVQGGSAANSGTSEKFMRIPGGDLELVLTTTDAGREVTAATEQGHLKAHDLMANGFGARLKSSPLPLSTGMQDTFSYVHMATLIQEQAGQVIGGNQRGNIFG